MAEATSTGFPCWCTAARMNVIERPTFTGSTVMTTSAAVGGRRNWTPTLRSARAGSSMESSMARAVTAAT